MISRYPLLLALAFNATLALSPELHAGRPNPGAPRDRVLPRPLTGIEKYGDPKSISSKDVARLPDHLTLDKLYKKWGYAHLGDPPLFLQYHADGDFWFYVSFDLDDIPTILAGDYHKVEILGVTLVGVGRYEQFPFAKVWTSTRVSPATKVSIEQIRDLPDELYFDQIQSWWGKSRISGLASDATVAMFGRHSRDMFPPVASVAYHTPMDGYRLVFFLDWASAAESVAGKKTRVKVTSIYTMGPNSKAILEWGSYINLKTGSLYNPPPKKDPFAPDTEPRPKGFLGLE
ncbi:hypothetical protein [Rariglobus hedericola]|uniref:Uncharacterized protein n=1 Tax=Rariglobus hedericola TaxID=2597822 RepID=A0A556QRG6_9BACT|nr:hypothetical protein [Rariglobus hedericola]TSJ79237.1 hypothetical protein FPL22_08075 [Rariglobus hedericola]